MSQILDGGSEALLSGNPMTQSNDTDIGVAIPRCGRRHFLPHHQRPCGKKVKKST